jgi:hypothetical protein
VLAKRRKGERERSRFTAGDLAIGAVAKVMAFCKVSCNRLSSSESNSSSGSSYSSDITVAGSSSGVPVLLVTGELLHLACTIGVLQRGSGDDLQEYDSVSVKLG